MAKIPVSAGTVIAGFAIFAIIIAGALYGLSFVGGDAPATVTAVNPVITATPGHSIDVAFTAVNDGPEPLDLTVTLEGPEGITPSAPLTLTLAPGESAGRFMTADIAAGMAPGVHRLRLVPTSAEGEQAKTLVNLRVLAGGVGDVTSGKLVNVSVTARSGQDVILTTVDAYGTGAFGRHSEFQAPQKYGSLEIQYPLGPPFDVAFNDLDNATAGEMRSVTVPPNAIWRNTVTLDRVYANSIGVPVENSMRRNVIETNRSLLQDFINREGTNVEIADGSQITIPDQSGDVTYLMELDGNRNVTLRERAVVGNPLARTPTTLVGADWTTRVTSITNASINYEWVPPAEGTRFTYLGDRPLSYLQDRAVVGGVANGNITVTFDVADKDTFAGETPDVQYEIRDSTANGFRLYGESKSPFANLETRWIFTVHNVR